MVLFVSISLNLNQQKAGLPLRMGARFFDSPEMADQSPGFLVPDSGEQTQRVHPFSSSLVPPQNRSSPS